MDDKFIVPIVRKSLRPKTIWVVALLMTLVLGILLRLSFGGFASSLLSKINLRQAHTHLGFYGFLFPFVWQQMKNDRIWVPGRKLSFFYAVAVAISIIAFAWQGYGLVSRVCSTIVLAIWIAFAVKNFFVEPPSKKSWISAVPLSIFCAAIFVSLVAISSIAGKSNLSSRFVSAFLTTLSFGVFVPIALERLRFYCVLRGWAWVLLTIGFSIFQLNVDGVSRVFVWAPILIGYFILHTVIQGQTIRAAKCRRLNFYWIMLAVSLLFRGVGVLPDTHAVGVAGVHFLILGPLIVSFLPINLPILAICYDTCVGVMIAALLGLEYLPKFYVAFQFVAASSGVGVLFVQTASLTKVMARRPAV